MGWVRAAAAEARSQVAASQMMINDRKVFILFIHYSLFIHSIFGWWVFGWWGSVLQLDKLAVRIVGGLLGDDGEAASDAFRVPGQKVRCM